jgi:Transglycosylase SLT domain
VAPGRGAGCSFPVSVCLSVGLRHRNRNSLRDAFAVGHAVRNRVAVGHGLAISLRVPERHGRTYPYADADCHGNADCHTFPRSDTLAYCKLCRPGRVVDSPFTAGTGCLRVQRHGLRGAARFARAVRDFLAVPLVLVRVLHRVAEVTVAALLAAGPTAALTADTASSAWTRPSTLMPAPAPPAHTVAPVTALPSTAPPGGSQPVSRTTAVPGTQAGSPQSLGLAPQRLIVPDLAVVVPAGITAGQVATIRTLPGVRAVLAVDGGQVAVNGHLASVLGVPVQAFRSWTPPVTAAAEGVWTVLAAGDLVAANSAGATLNVTLGVTYPVAGAVRAMVPVMATAPLGIPGVEAVVSAQRGTQLGLAQNVAVLVNAPGADYATLISRIRDVTGRRASIINLVPVVEARRLPVVPTATTAQPGNYLQLYQESAAVYCPGLSWTVLAAIGEIESGNGANDGPSSAGALGPMQFMPGTWAVWATVGFGTAGPADIMNPYDAVPAAARLLCADGARHGSTGLASAIFGYNHATWYVSEVLDLAAEYAREYPSAGKR